MSLYTVIELHLSERSTATRLAYQLRYDRWCEFLGSPWKTECCEYMFLNATPELAADFMALERSRPSRVGRNGETGRATSTVWVTIACLHSIYERLKAHGLVKENPFAIERAKRYKRVIEKRRTEMIPFEKVMEMINRPSRHTEEGRKDRAMLALLFACGFRRSEMTNLKLRDIRQSATGVPFLRLAQSKRSVNDDQALPEWAAEVLSEWVQHRAADGARLDDYVFPSPYGNGKKIHDCTVYLMFKRYLREVGLDPKNYSPHSARATAITKLLVDGVSYREVQEFSRHESVSMVEWYDKRFFGVEKNPGRGLKF